MKIISLCGVVCSECRYYPDGCPGCPAIQGDFEFGFGGFGEVFVAKQKM